MVSKRADELLEGTWTPPTSFHSELLRERPDGHLFNTISTGIRNMPAYGSQIAVEDRWAIVAYVRALQRSQNATVDDVPSDIRAQLR
jgi:mono/diheme cytochrome c family protein